MITKKREGLSSDCTLNKLVILAITMAGNEHPCDRCNMDRSVCRGYPRIGEDEPILSDSEFNEVQKKRGV